MRRILVLVLLMVSLLVVTAAPTHAEFCNDGCSASL